MFNFLRPAEKYVCPYCFERFDRYMFQCTNNKCTQKGDKIFTASNSNSAVCTTCKQITYKKVCPFCKNELPESTLKHSDCIISIVGSRASGKSHFVGVLIHEMIKRIAPQINHGSFEGFSDSYQRYVANFQNEIYQGQALPLSQKAIVNKKVSEPYIFKYSFRDRKNKKENKVYTFVFFDTAGEDLMEDDNMSTVNKYIYESSGIIFLLDPMNMPGLVQKIHDPDNTIINGSSGGVTEYDGAAYDIITRVSKLIRNHKKLSENKKIDIPVAAVFSKYDSFDALVPEGSNVKLPSPHCELGRFDDNDRRAVNDEIASLLDGWGATSFTSQLENNYKTYSYFAVSSLGLYNIPHKGRFDIPHPHRIEDPLLWLMKIGGKLE